MSRRHTLNPSAAAAPAKIPIAELIRDLGALGCPVELIASLVEITERGRTRRPKRIFSAAVQDLFGGDGMVDDPGTVGLDALESTLRKMCDNLSAHIGDEKKARRMLLDALPARKRRIWAALLVRKRGRPPGDAGRVARKDAAWLAVYKWKQAKDSTLGPWKFARWLHEEMGHGPSTEANYKKLSSLLRK